MLKLSVPQKVLAAAEVRSKELGTLNESIRQGKGNFSGFVFEEAHRWAFGGQCSAEQDVFDFDLLMPNPNWLKSKPGLGTKVDCKAKERTVNYVDPTWDASVAANAGRGTLQKCDCYSFGSVHVDSSGSPLFVVFCGVIHKQVYLRGRSLRRQGVEVDCWNRPVRRWGDLADGAELREEGKPYDYNGFVCRENCWNRPYSYLHQIQPNDLSDDAKGFILK